MKKSTLIIMVSLGLFNLLLWASTTSTAKQGTRSTETVLQESGLADAEGTKGYAVGDEAIDFSLPSTADAQVSLADFPNAKGFIVIFTCNHCPYAVRYEDRIIALNQKYASQGYPVIAINPNDPAIVPEDGMEEMKVRASEKGFTFPYLMDTEQAVYPVYGATKTPHVYLLNKEDEKLIVKYIGAIDNNHKDASKVSKRYVEDAVDALLAGTAIPVTSSKAIGCSIKAKK